MPSSGMSEWIIEIILRSLVDIGETSLFKTNEWSESFVRVTVVVEQRSSVLNVIERLLLSGITLS
jgi:hypothetical protein